MKLINFLDTEFTTLNEYLSELNPSKILILVDENTHEYCLPQLLGNLETEIPFEIIEIEAGEELKNIETATQLWEIFAEFEADRKALLINLGGGVISDLGGFVASTYKRGIKFINIPTTLLGMCDASIGGKTGIDLNHLKNMMGTFSEPEKVFIFPEFLTTLPMNELRSGFAEMLKHGLIADQKHWKDLTSIEELTPENIYPYIETSMKIKEKIVSEDFKEQHVRKNLNFGHTFGHAIESLFLEMGEKILHGEAVAIGMIMETHLSFLENLIDEKTSQYIIESIGKFFPYISIEQFSSEQIVRLMQNDKKNEDNKIYFSLLNSLGSCRYDCQIPVTNISESVNFYKYLN